MMRIIKRKDFMNKRDERGDYIERSIWFKFGEIKEKERKGLEER